MLAAQLVSRGMFQDGEPAPAEGSRAGDRAPVVAETIVPLVETRLQAILRRGRTGATAEWDGGLVIAGVNAPR